MALNQMGLGFLFTAKDEASAVMAKIDRAFGKLNGSARELVKQELFQGALGGGAMLAGLGTLKKEFSIAQEAGLFEQGLQDVRAIAQGTAADLQLLEDAALSSSFGTQFNPKQVVDGLRDLAQAGFNAKESIDLLKPTLNMASGSLGELDVQKSGAVIAQTLKSFRIAADQAGPTVDKLLAISASSSVAIRELPSLIGHVARGAASYGSSLEEALIASGLARNVMGNIELASTGVSMAMERLVDPKRQKALAKIGVSATDAAGNFKPLLDVLMEIQNSPIFGRMTHADQSAAIFKVFGARALGAVNAIFSQLSSGIRTSTNELVRGTDAVKYMREQQEAALGTAKRLTEAHLNSLPGQLALLKASVAQARVLLGKEFSTLFRPVVEGFKNVFDSLVQTWYKLPTETKQMFAKLALGVTLLTTAFGGLVAAKAGIIVLGALLSSLGVTISGLLWSVAPVAAAVLALAGASYVAYRAYKANFGGFGDFVTNAFDKTKLAVQGLIQLFSKGEFSGEVMKEMDKSANSGVRGFVITLFMWGARIKNFFVGIWQGLKDNFEVIRPLFEAVLDTFRRLGEALGISVGKADDNARAFDKFGEAGRDVGNVLSKYVISGLELVREILELLIIVIDSSRNAWSLFGDSASGSIDMVRGSLQLLFGTLTNDGSMFWRGFVNSTFGAVKTIVSALFGLEGAIGQVFDGLNRMLGIESHFRENALNNKTAAMNELNEAQQFWINYGTEHKPSEKTDTPDYSLMSSMAAGPMSVAAEVNASYPEAIAKAVTSAIMSTQTRSAATTSSQPQQININVDGQRFMSVMVDAQRANANASYEPVSSGSPE